MGRDTKYPGDLTPEIRHNAEELVGKVNNLLAMAEAAGAAVRWEVRSGWRPAAVNDRTSNAAKASKHLAGRAVDIADPGRALAAWCVLHPDALEQCGLWMEDPRWTPTWTHLQSVPPGSGLRVYRPSSAPALVGALPGQREIA